MFYLFLKERPEVLGMLRNSDARYAKALVKVVKSFDDAAIGTAKVHWLQQFTKFDFSVSSTVNVWGCEQDMFVPCLESVTASTLDTTCTSNHCPKRHQQITRSSLEILGIEVENVSQTYLEALFYSWLSPPPKPCNAEFQQSPPPSALTKFGCPQLVVPGNFWTKPLCCGGTRLSQPRQFSNGPPWVLPIFLGDLAQTDKLNGPAEIPTYLEIPGAKYQLGSVTSWNGVHYIA